MDATRIVRGPAPAPLGLVYGPSPTHIQAVSAPHPRGLGQLLPESVPKLLLGYPRAGP
jgi:hypothetical protein